MKRYILFFCFTSVLCTLTVGTVSYVFIIHPLKTDTLDFEIPVGIHPAQLATRLAIESPEIHIPFPLFNQFVFRIYYKTHPLQAGNYTLHSDETIYNWLKKFQSGKPKLYPVTFAEGFSIYDIAKQLQDTSIVKNTNRFISLTHNPKLLVKYKIPGPSMEGYLFPSTYYFPKSFSEKRVIQIMLNTFYEKVKHQPFKSSHPYLQSFHEYLILASIIEKETGSTEELERIAGVFHNRLENNMRLESDPTTIYGITNFNGNLTRKDLRTKTPYNTYTIYGLPKGPICNPGTKAIEAAFNPEKHNFIFFVSTNNGRHIFSETYKEHHKNVTLYQLHGRFRKKAR